MQIITPGMRLIPEAVLANDAALFRTIQETPSHAGKSLHRVVIVGGGAGGLELATRLGRKFGKRRQGTSPLDRILRRLLGPGDGPVPGSTAGPADHAGRTP